MKKLWIVLALVLASTSVFAQSNVRPMYDNTSNGGTTTQTVDPTHGLPVQVVSPGGTTPVIIYQKNVGTTTYTPTSVALTGASQTLLAASTTRTGFTVYNPTVNGNVYVSISGSTVVADQASLLSPGGTMVVSGSAGPKTAVTIIGTVSQVVYVEEGN